MLTTLGLDAIEDYHVSLSHEGMCSMEDSLEGWL